MRIAHLLKHGVAHNGHVHVAVDLACAQADAGHDVVFAAARPEFADVLVAHGVTLATIPEASGVRGAVSAAAAIARLVTSFDPDLVHAHMMSSAVLAYPFCKLTRTPLVTTVHNSFDRHSVLMRLGDVVVAVSEAERRLLVSRGYPEDRLVTVVNGADRSPREEVPSTPVELRLPCVVTLSGLHQRKAVDDALRAFAQVAEQFPAWHLNVIGDGPDRETLRQQAEDLALADRIHFLGPSYAPQRLLEQADIFVTATLADPCPLSVMEARAAGCAIVATRVGGIPETLDHGGAGILVAPRSPSSMADGLRVLMGDTAVREQWQNRARDGSDYFTVKRMSDDYLDLYARVVGTVGDAPARSRRAPT